LRDSHAHVYTTPLLLSPIHTHTHTHIKNTQGDGFYTFPPLSRLAAASEEELRGLGLGYRARFIRETAQKLVELGGEEWLLALREKERKEAQVCVRVCVYIEIYEGETAVKLVELGGEGWLLVLRKGEEGGAGLCVCVCVHIDNPDTYPHTHTHTHTQEALTTFPGVGRKVADCVALFSLDQKGAIPVDVHVGVCVCVCVCVDMYMCRCIPLSSFSHLHTHTHTHTRAHTHTHTGLADRLP
jgi:hypothetical protein